LALKESDVTFEDIKKTIDKIKDRGFDYDTAGGRHAVFHMILNDLDTLCQSGDAARAFENVNESEVSEVYRITPKGSASAEALLLRGQGHQK
jgi:hypothetical protein